MVACTPRFAWSCCWIASITGRLNDELDETYSCTGWLVGNFAAASRLLASATLDLQCVQESAAGAPGSPTGAKLASGRPPTAVASCWRSSASENACRTRLSANAFTYVGKPR